MNRNVLIFLVGALAAGGVIGYVAGSSAGGGGAYTLPGEAEEDFAWRPSSPRPEEDDPEAVGGGRYHDLAHALSSIRVPRTERGDGTITGRVLTADGEPLSGVVIRAGLRGKPDPSRRHRRGKGPPEDQEIEEYVRERVKQYLSGLESRREARSDAEGNYTISGISKDPEDRYYVNGYCRGFEFQQTPYVRDIRDGATVNFTAKSIHTIPCHVYLPDGTMPEKASINVRTGNRSRGYTWYLDTPELQLDPGDHQLQATGGENNIYRSEEVSVSVVKGEIPSSLEIRMKDEPGVCGKIEFPPGETNLRLQVALLKLSEGAETKPDRLLREGRKASVYGSRQNYVFRDIGAGTYLLGLIFNRQIVIDQRTVQVGKAMITEDFTMPAPDDSQFLMLRILSPKGTPVAGVNFSVGYRSESFNGSSGSRYQQMPDGRWRVFHYAVKEEQKKPGGTWFVTARSQTLGSKTVEYDATNTKDLTIRFEEPAKLTVTVAGYRGSGMEGKIRLEVRPAQKGRTTRSYGYYGRNASKLDAEGVQKFGPLAPGEHDIHVQVKGKNNRWSGADIVTTHLKAGENSATVDLPKLYSLTVIVDGEQENASFRLSANMKGYWYNSDTVKPKGGQVLFDNLVPGDYTLQCWGATHGTMKISIPAQSSVRFVATVYNAQKVHVKDVNGTFVKAGLRQDDLLIGIDGEEFTNQRTMQAMMTLAMERKSVSLLILRGGRRLTIPVDFTQAYNMKVAGITWERVGR